MRLRRHPARRIPPSPRTAGASFRQPARRWGTAPAGGPHCHRPRRSPSRPIPGSYPPPPPASPAPPAPVPPALTGHLGAWGWGSTGFTVIGAILLGAVMQLVIYLVTQRAASKPRHSVRYALVAVITFYAVVSVVLHRLHAGGVHYWTDGNPGSRHRNGIDRRPYQASRVGRRWHQHRDQRPPGHRSERHTAGQRRCDRLHPGDHPDHDDRRAACRRDPVPRSVRRITAAQGESCSDLVVGNRVRGMAPSTRPPCATTR